MNHLHDNRLPSGRYEPGSGSRGRRDLIGSLADAARENPMSAALIGMGALWLFMGGNSMSLLGGKGRTSILGAAAHGAGNAASGAAHAASRAGSAVGSTVSSAVSGLSETVTDAASRVGDYVSGSIHGVDAQAEYRNADLSGEGDGTLSGRSGMDGRFQVASLRENMHDLFDRHPVALGIAGLALGAGIAASLPLTGTERETLGKAGEAVRQKVGQAAGQAKEFAGAAMAEARQQGRGSGS